MSETASTELEPGVISVGVGVGVDVSTAHGNDWFPLRIDAGLWTSTLYLKRAQLKALRQRLDQIDDTLPEVEQGV